MKFSFPSKAILANAALLPIKQHVICCGFLPAAASLVSGTAGSQILHDPVIELTTNIVIPPAVTYGVILAEQKWNDWKAKKQNCNCRHRTLNLKNYFKQTALSYGIYFAAHILLHPEHQENKHSLRQHSKENAINVLPPSY